MLYEMKITTMRIWNLDTESILRDDNYYIKSTSPQYYTKLSRFVVDEDRISHVSAHVIW